MLLMDHTGIHCNKHADRWYQIYFFSHKYESLTFRLNSIQNGFYLNGNY